MLMIWCVGRLGPLSSREFLIGDALERSGFAVAPTIEDLSGDTVIACDRRSWRFTLFTTGRDLVDMVTLRSDAGRRGPGLMECDRVRGKSVD